MSSPIEQPKLLYQSAKEAISERYVSKLSACGGRIPAERRLASELGVNIGTVAKALNELAMQGFVRRRVGSGTYVIPQSPTQLAVGIYFGGPVLDGGPIKAIFGPLDAELQRLLHARAQAMRHYVDTRIRERQGSPFAELLEDVQDRKISSLIVGCANRVEYAWLATLPIPVIGHGVDYGHGGVGLDLYSFSKQAVQFLADRGCRQIGLISSISTESRPREFPNMPLHEGFHDTLRDTHAATRPEWVLADRQHLGDASVDPECFGYTSFKTLWNQPQRPEGLVIFTDISALGVVRAARELNVQLGRDIQVIVHANRENAWPDLAGFPKLIFSANEIARELQQFTERDGKNQPGRQVLVSPERILPPESQP